MPSRMWDSVAILVNKKSAGRINEGYCFSFQGRRLCDVSILKDADDTILFVENLQQARNLKLILRLNIFEV